MFDLAAAHISQSFADNGIMNGDEFHRGLISHLLGETGGINNVRKKNRPNARVPFFMGGTRQHDSTPGVDRAIAHEQLGHFWVYFDELSGDDSMRFLMHL